MPKGRSATVFALVLGAFLYVPALTWHEQGVEAAFRFFAADAFYYLAVADHSAGAPFYTFDRQHPTNGFHPLWQYSLAAAVSGLGLSGENQIVFCFWASVVLAGIGIALFATAVARSTGSSALALLAAVPGFYFLLLPRTNPQLFAAWSFANGMESAASLLCFGVLCHLLVNRRLLRDPSSISRILTLALTLSLCVLSRLDDVFLLLPFLAHLWLGAPSWPARLRRAAAFCVPPALAIGSYLAYNLASVGIPLPVSGAAKAEGLLLGLLRNGYALVTSLAPFVDLFGRGQRAWGDEAWRVLQMLAPAALAAAWLVTVPPPAPAERPREDDARRALRLLAVYVLLKAAYNFALVGLWHQGHWYFPVSILTASWMVASAISTVLARAGVALPPLRLRSRELRLRPSRWALGGACLLVLLHANAFVETKRTSEQGEANHRFWTRGEAVSQALAERCPGCGLVELDDGILSYALTLPVMSGLGFALDPAAFAALRQGRLLDVAFERGFRLLATLNYPMPPEAYQDDARLAAALAANGQLRGQQLERFAFSVVYVDPVTRVAFVGFRPRAGP